MLIELLWFSFCPAKMPRQRRIPAPPPGRGGQACPGLGSPGLALGGVTFWGAQPGEDSGSRRRPGSYLVGPDGATPIWALASEAAGLRDGDTSPY